MIAERDRKIAEELKEKLLHEARGQIRKVILYGSRARGAASRDSDFDLMVIEADPDRKSVV
jgi:predicted nucleotidyltransferase